MNLFTHDKTENQNLKILKLKTPIMLLILIALFNQKSFSSETDQFMSLGKDIKDSKNVINKILRLKLEKTVKLR